MKTARKALVLYVDNNVSGDSGLFFFFVQIKLHRLLRGILGVSRMALAAQVYVFSISLLTN